MSADVDFRAFLHGPSDERLLDAVELERAATMVPEARMRFVSGRVAQRKFAAELLGVPTSALTTHYSCHRCGTGPTISHGRPGYSRNGVPVPLLLSLSRAAEWMLLAGVLLPEAGLRLGVDVEDPSHVDFAGFDAVALTDDERQEISALTGRQLAHSRTRLWTRKEAWLKMTGEGLHVSPASLDVRDRSQLTDLESDVSGLPAELVAAVACG